MYNYEGLLQLDEVLKQLIRIGSTEWRKFSDGALTRSHILILEKLNGFGRQHVTNLSEALSITPGGITGICDKLVKEGLVQRLREEKDRRVVFLEITDKGREELQKMIEIRKKFIVDMYGKLSEEDLQHLIRIYSHLLQSYQDHEHAE